MSRVIIRQKIIMDAAALFEQKGFQNVSIPDIEKATGKTKAVLYGYFVNRQSLVNAVLEYNLTQRRNQIQKQAALCSSSISKLLVHIEVHDLQKRSLVTGGNPVAIADETKQTQEEMRRIIAAAIMDWKQDIAELINAGVQTGEFDTNTGSEDLAWLLISAVEGAILISQITQDVRLGHQLLEQAKKTFLNT